MDGIRSWIEAEGAGHWFFLAFPIMLLCLFIWFKGRRVRFLIPSLLMTIVIVNPVFYRVWDSLGLYAYWRILWIIPVIPVSGAVVPMVTERVQNGWLKSTAVVAGLGAVVLSGTLLYSGPGGSFVKAANSAKLPQDVVEIADRLLVIDEDPRVIADTSISTYIRQYSGQIDSLFGRDIVGFILHPNEIARNTYNSMNNGDWNSVSMSMLNHEYEYLVTTKAMGEGFQIVGNTDNYGIYKALGTPNLREEKNELGQLLSITSINEKGETIDNINGYSTTIYNYDENGNITFEAHKNAEGKLVANELGIAGYRHEYNSRSEMVFSQMIGIDYKPIMTSAGYSSWRTVFNGLSKDIEFLDDELSVLPNNGINLAKDIDYDENGWTDWITPPANAEIFWLDIGSLYLFDKNVGDTYTCQVEVEYKDVSSSPTGEDFGFWTQGTADGQWNVGNVWNWVVYLTDAPKDGIYKYVGNGTVNEAMKKASSFSIGFRCDNWKSGSFRVRHIKIEKGNEPSVWTPGVTSGF